MRRSFSNLGFKKEVQFNSLCEEDASPPRDPLALRRCLQNRFDSECPYSLASLSTTGSSDSTWPSVSSLNSNLNLKSNPRRMLRSSASKLTKSFGNLRTTIEEFSQKFRASTRRRSRLSDSPITPNTPHSRTRKILGRTPTKLYSPFSIITPSPGNRRSRCNKENLSTPRRNNLTPLKKNLDKAAPKKSDQRFTENKSLVQKFTQKNEETHRLMEC
ncbi:unnamed protein product [Bemisia tabaci]|uniref:Uncharacterized protein n=1 Tax=Bemisia tabaci TaxID=7038 RepID=A0A9P0A6H8_BEMTA|nr:PREDICTED: uncharacterized protein LOC109043595 [Bemisia tabaci]CAH0384378.1 unnamed protein product [Bemisia tabaci]